MLWKDVPNVKNASVIDVRSEEEYELGHPDKSVNIPWDLHQYYLEELESLPRPWLFVCEEGIRSGWVVLSLKMLGFKDVYNVGRWIDVGKF